MTTHGFGSAAARGGPVATSIAVTDTSQVGEARRAATLVAVEAGCDAEARGKVALLATELASNLARHAREGELYVRHLRGDDGRGVELLAVDRGPGIGDVGGAMRDGFSTRGTRGAGLGALERMASRFDMYSSMESGTVIMARVLHSDPPADARAEVGVVATPYPGETACGDAWLVAPHGRGVLAMVVDGLGHGASAAEAADAAVRAVHGALHRHADAEPGEILQAVHGELRSTRGAAAAVVVIDTGARQARFAGIGNVAGAVVLPGAQRSMMSQNGILGHQTRSVQPMVYPMEPGAVALLYSDGIGTRWRSDAWPGLAGRHPALLAGRIHRDFTRGRDDATVLAVRPLRGVA